VPAADRYPLLLSPYEIRGRRLRNRIVSTPHATGWSRDGLIDRSEVDYHVRKAAGGCGLVMTFGSASTTSKPRSKLMTGRPARPVVEPA
jgi:2,4-dienoyl-CoA reductase-like NADH-dependent reductase (Old Yellow Enzyme family)